MEHFLSQLKTYNTIAIAFHYSWDNKEIIEEISNNINEDAIIIIKDDKKSQLVRRIMYPKRINIRSVCLDATSNIDLILKGNPDFSILLCNDSPDENLLKIYNLLILNKKQFILINNNNDIIMNINKSQHIEEKPVLHKNMDVNYNKYQQIIDDKYIETFKNTTELVNDLNLRQKSKRKIVKQLKKLHYYETVRNNNMKTIKEIEEHNVNNDSVNINTCISLTSKGKRCKNNALKGSKYCGIKSHKIT